MAMKKRPTVFLSRIRADGATLPTPRCPTLVDHGYCTKHKTTSPTKNILRTYKWQQFRKRWLGEHPLCGDCEKEGLVTIATDVHHKVKHYGKESICFDWSNLMSLCSKCHDSRTLKGE